jgi:hypothetical protein
MCEEKMALEWMMACLFVSHWVDHWMPKDTPLGFVFINDHLSCAVTVQPIALT